VLGAAWLTARLLDRRKLAGLGFHFRREWWIDFGFGLALGAVLMGLIFLVERAAGWLTVTGAFFPGNTGLAFLVAILSQAFAMLGVGLSEETLFRGYQIKNLAEGLRLGRISPRVAAILGWLISSVVFGLAHAGNPNASPIAVFNIFIAGLFLGLGLLLTGDLALGIGLHIAWNFFEGNVFGFPDSGTGVGTAPTFLTINQGGPALWTGGAFGPEAGLMGILAILLGSALILGWLRYRRGGLSIHAPLAEPPNRPALAAPATPASIPEG
jgi:CAAX protease family protein